MRRIRVVVADQAEARFFDTTDHGLTLTSAGALQDPEGRLKEHDLVTDKPGSASGHGHYALQPHGSRKEHDVGLFAKKIADKLLAESNAGEFDDLALIAAPHFLGILRKALPPVLHTKVRHEIVHDLVHQSEAVIRAHLPVSWPTP